MAGVMIRPPLSCSFDRVYKVYAAGSILGAKPLSQFQSCIGSESSVSSRFFLGNGSGPFGTRRSSSFIDLTQCREAPIH